MEQDPAPLRDIKPALYANIREAQLSLKPGSFPDDKIVHDIRVLMKKSRAALKLLNHRLDEKTFNREYKTLLEVGHLMQSARETSVYRKLLKDLKRKYQCLFYQLQENEMINSLIKKPEKDFTSSDKKVEEDLNKILELLRTSGYRIRFLSLKVPDSQLLVKELETTYEKVKVSYMMARNCPGVSNLHKFRKISKDFLYQLCFFRGLNTRVIKNLEKRLDQMTQYLGRYHDLALLIKALDYRYYGFDNNPDIDELILLIRQDQDRCLENVWTKAFKIFCPGNCLGKVLGLKLLVI